MSNTTKEWFGIPIYCRADVFSFDEKTQLYNSFVKLKDQDALRTYNGTSHLTYGTNIISVLDMFNLQSIKEKIRLYCNDFLIECGTKFKRVDVNSDWLIGYNKNEYQGEHNHGYVDNVISGVVYVRVPENSSPIIFSTPTPFITHACLKNLRDSVFYTPAEGMIIIFPSFLKHKVMPNTDISDGSLRLGLSFNAAIS